VNKYPSVDYHFRPPSYWDAPDPLAAILRNIKGDNRRKMIRDFWESNRLEDLDPTLLQDEVDETSRDALVRIDPTFMGGEYLPGYRLGEVEIARICLASLMSDVISIRARPTVAGIAYRVVDEHDGEYQLTINESRDPLDLIQMIQLIDEGLVLDDDYSPGLALCFNDYNVQEGSSRAKERNFTRIESDIYRQLSEHYEHVLDDWLSGG
jgi:hypothetical protein